VLGRALGLARGRGVLGSATLATLSHRAPRAKSKLIVDGAPHHKRALLVLGAGRVWVLARVLGRGRGMRVIHVKHTRRAMHAHTKQHVDGVLPRVAALLAVPWVRVWGVAGDLVRGRGRGIRVMFATHSRPALHARIN